MTMGGGRRVARPVNPMPNPYWVDQWERNPQKNESLNFISQETKDKVRQIADYLPNLNDQWPKGVNEPVKGAVLGLVQSGKTAAMVGLISHLFDKGFDAVAVLTGTSSDLNMQTAIRLKNDVFDWGEEVTDGQGVSVLFCTSVKGPGSHKDPQIIDGVDFFTSPITQNASDWQHWQRARQVLKRKKPSLFVAKKNAGVILQRMQRFMESHHNACMQMHERPLRWAIIDDECDQVSTGGNVDAVTPSQLHAITQIGECAYIGFTATPQANLFIPDPEQNPLFPEDFCAVLRSPHHWDVVAEDRPSQDLCYHTDSINGMYCGGWVFHNWCDAYRGGITNYFHQEVDMWDGKTVEPENDDGSDNTVAQGFNRGYIEAFAHYLVSGAARYILDGQPQFHTTWMPLETQFPKPHTMLVNPNTSRHAHWLCAEVLINHLRVAGNQRRMIRLTGPQQDSANENFAAFWEEARSWISDFVQLHRAVFKSAYQNQLTSYDEVDRVSWDAGYTEATFPTFDNIVTQIDLLKDHIKLKVLNGQTTGQHRLQFDSQIHPTDGSIRIPDDVYTIAIGGTKLGRGITLNGLCTTLYLTNSPADDNSIQTQRWFGYRGSHIEYIRVFMPNDTWRSSTPNHLDGFNEKNATLTDLLQMAADCENNNIQPNISDPAWSFCLGPNSNPSNKIPTRHTFGYANLFITKYVTPLALNRRVATHNMQQINNLYDTMVNTKNMPQGIWEHPTWNNPLGVFCGIPFDGNTNALGNPNGQRFTAIEIADFLDSLHWSQHNPSQDRHPIRINPDDLPTNIPNPFHRESENYLGHEETKIPSRSDPYLMAALLRLWHYGHEDYAANQGPDGIPEISQRCEYSPPEFNVLIRSGGQQSTHTFAGGEIVRYRESIGPNGLNIATGQITNLYWGSKNRSTTWGSDIRADDIRNNWPTDRGWESFRRTLRTSADSEPGLLLIYLIDDSAGGYAPAIFMSVPDGGPSYNYI